jgi:hypothetical protein
VEDRVEDHKLIGDTARFSEKRHAFGWFEMSVEVAREESRHRVRTQGQGGRIRSYRGNIAHRGLQPM